MEENAKRLAVHSSQRALIGGFAQLLSEHGAGWQLCELPRVSDTNAWWSAVEKSRPHVVLIDCLHRVPRQLISDLRRVLPDSRILLWVEEPSLTLANYAHSLDVRGIVKVEISGDLFLRCIERVYSGELWYERSVTEGLMNSVQIKLSRREHQLLAAVSKGLSNKEIASLLGLKEGTIKFYLSRLFRKCGVLDRLELALFGLRYLFQQGSMDEEEVVTPNMPVRLFVEAEQVVQHLKAG
jgi:DNA-binding NarL/FixJ family response regulator